MSKRGNVTSASGNSGVLERAFGNARERVKPKARNTKVSKETVSSLQKRQALPAFQEPECPIEVDSKGVTIDFSADLLALDFRVFFRCFTM